MANVYLNNPQDLEDDVKEVLATYQGYANKMPNHSKHTDGYIKGLQELVAQGVKQYATQTEADIDALYEQKIKSMPVPFGTDPYYDGYAQAYNDLWKLCYGDGEEVEIFNNVRDIKAKFNLP